MEARDASSVAMVMEKSPKPSGSGSSDIVVFLLCFSPFSCYIIVAKEDGDDQEKMLVII